MEKILNCCYYSVIAILSVTEKTPINEVSFVACKSVSLLMPLIYNAVISDAQIPLMGRLSLVCMFVCHEVMKRNEAFSLLFACLA